MWFLRLGLHHWLLSFKYGLGWIRVNAPCGLHNCVRFSFSPSPEMPAKQIFRFIRFPESLVLFFFSTFFQLLDSSWLPTCPRFKVPLSLSIQTVSAETLEMKKFPHSRKFRFSRLSVAWKKKSTLSGKLKYRGKNFNIAEEKCYSQLGLSHS